VTLLEERVVDVEAIGVRALNRALHAPDVAASAPAWRIRNPHGQHALACGIDAAITVDIDGHVGYYCAGMNQRATVRVHGNAGPGVAENMASGCVIVAGDASQSAGSSGIGGLLHVHGNAAARCGISMKGIDIVVRGDIGHLGAFMGQAGTLVVCGAAGDALGDSLYEARIFVRGAVASLGADCIEKPLRETDRAQLAALLARSGETGFDPAAFRRYGSARRLYHFDARHRGAHG
jgi:glutamate synthase domain-containing protein 3